jgi:hypothetical protein
MLMHDFKKVRGYNPILFLRTAIKSSKPAARCDESCSWAENRDDGSRYDCRVPQFPLSHFMWSLQRRQNGERRQIVALCGIFGGRWHE